MAMLLRAARTTVRTASRASLRSGAGRRMCTAVAEEAEAAASPFSISEPHNQMMYAIAGVTYLFALKWQSADRKLAKEIAEHKAAHAPAEEDAAVVATIETTSAAAPAAVSPIVAAVAASAPSGAAPVAWKVADVCAWLDSIELGMHAESFKTHSVNGKMLLALSEQDLYSTLNVVSPLHRKKLLMEVAALRKAYLQG